MPFRVAGRDDQSAEIDVAGAVGVKRRLSTVPSTGKGGFACPAHRYLRLALSPRFPRHRGRRGQARASRVPASRLGAVIVQERGGVSAASRAHGPSGSVQRAASGFTGAPRSKCCVGMAHRARKPFSAQRA